MEFTTADLYDEQPDHVWVARPLFTDYGGRRRFSGPIETAIVHEDDHLIRTILAEPGEGRILVVDGGGSLRCAILDAPLARIAHDNGWAGLVLAGAVRNAALLAEVPIGIKALGATPRGTVLSSEGVRSLPLHFADVAFKPGHCLYADEDGILLSWASLPHDPPSAGPSDPEA